MRENAKPLYFPWNEEAFQSDLDVRSMSPIQRWVYRTLLQNCFFVSSRPNLPNDDNLLWVIAGCRSKKEWDKNKQIVLKKFGVLNIDGQTYLRNSRVDECWSQLLDRRERMVEMGKRSAEIRQMLSVGSTDAQPTMNGSSEEVEQEKLSKEELREEREVRNSTRPSLAKQFNILREIPRLCRVVLGIRPEPIEWRKEEFKELAETYGSARVCEAFESWAETRKGQEIKRPLLEFIQVADGILNNVIAVGENKGLLELNARLHEIGGQPFTGKHLAAVGALLKEYSADEIIRAYTEFTGIKDEFAMKTAVRDFAEGGAAAILLSIRKQQQEAAEQETVMQRQREEIQRQAAEDKIPTNPEDEFDEETLPHD